MRPLIRIRHRLASSKASSLIRATQKIDRVSEGSTTTLNANRRVSDVLSRWFNPPIGPGRLAVLNQASGCGRLLFHSGLHAVADLEGVDAERVCTQAAARKVEVVPLSAYHYGSGPVQNGLLLGFGACKPAAIRASMWQLAAAIDAARRA